MRMIINRGLTGNSISQYSIIIILVILALVPVFTFTGKNLIGHFENLYKGLNGELTDTNAQSSNQNSGQSLTESAYSNTSNECTDNNCTMTFGDDLVITDIPSNLTEIIETSGTAGGTESIAAILEQISKQVANSDQVSEEDKNKIDQLASLAYQLAEYEQVVEGFSKEGLAKFEACKASIDSNYLATLSDSAGLAYIEEKMLPMQEFLTESTENSLFEGLMQIYNNDSLASSAMLSAVNPQSETVTTTRQQFDDLLASLTASDSTLDPTLNQLVSTLGQDVQMLADNMIGSVQAYENTQTGIMDNFASDKTEFVNGAKTEINNLLSLPESEIQSYLDNPASITEDLNEIVSNLELHTDAQYTSDYLDSYEQYYKLNTIYEIAEDMQASGSELSPKQQALMTLIKDEINKVGEQIFTSDASPESLEYTLNSEFSLAAGFMDFVTQANDGLTSEQTNLDAKLMDISANNKEDAKSTPEEQEEQEEQGTEENNTDTNPDK